MPPLSVADLAAALHGLSRLLRLDREGFDYFDASATGLLKSFWVAVLLLPLFLLQLGLDLLLLDAPPVRFLSVQLIAYVMSWVAFPLAVLTVAPVIGVERTVFRFLVPLNWVQLPILLIALPLLVVARLQMLPVGVGAFALLLLLAAAQVITAALARHGLGVTWWSAVGITVLGFVLDRFIESVALSLSGIQWPPA